MSADGPGGGAPPSGVPPGSPAKRRGRRRGRKPSPATTDATGTAPHLDPLPRGEGVAQGRIASAKGQPGRSPEARSAAIIALSAAMSIRISAFAGTFRSDALPIPKSSTAFCAQECTSDDA